ncbi:MATE family efflux transporter [Sediminitomix flava]|uniref:Putative MATE family efflux protein n=1 Tax=Sediminitomix flava TaxID=379075 RepID=A0A315ZAZ4_SEDFL|nr:MATE family efflux transporter [Sediminitomix flava]PWJ42223.1 putative MATE family efflux protein [Sediminitomix flava]
MKKESVNQQAGLWKISWPLFLEILLFIMMGNADTLMLSQYADDAVAAVGVSNQVLNLLVIMFGFVTTGTAILVANALGANKEEKARDIITVSFWANGFFGLIISLLMGLFGVQIMQMMNLEDSLLAQAAQYTEWVGGFLVAQAMVMTVSASLRSYGYTKDSMLITLGMNIINVIGNYILVFGPWGLPSYGVMGVAFSTTFSRILGMIVGVAYLQYKLKKPIKSLKKIDQPKSYLRDLLRIGLPSAGEHLTYNATQMVITYIITFMGTAALTTKVYATNIVMFIFVAAIAIGQGTQILVSYKMGSKNYRDAYTQGISSLKIAIGISLVVALIVYSFADPILAIFTQDTQIITIAKQILLLSILMEPGRAFNLVMGNALRAKGDVKYPMYLAIGSMWGVAVVFSYVFGILFHWGLIGCWLAFTIDEWLRGVLMLIRWNKSFRSLKGMRPLSLT